MVCGTVREYRDILGMFLLKGLRPEKYKERVEMASRRPAHVCTVRSAQSQRCARKPGYVTSAQRCVAATLAAVCTE